MSAESESGAGVAIHVLLCFSLCGIIGGGRIAAFRETPTINSRWPAAASATTPTALPSVLISKGRQGWALWDEPCLRKHLQAMANEDYENQTLAVRGELLICDKLA